MVLDSNKQPTSSPINLLFRPSTLPILPASSILGQQPLGGSAGSSRREKLAMLINDLVDHPVFLGLLGIHDVVAGRRLSRCDRSAARMAKKLEQIEMA
jgi:hypothetical protein